MYSLSSEMMGEPALVAELDIEEMGPLISQEGLEQLQNKYVQKVRVRVRVGFYSLNFYHLHCLVWINRPHVLEKFNCDCLQKSVSEWMHKALEVELTDWQRDQEPDIDHEGCYHTSLPTIIAQVLQQWLDLRKQCCHPKL